MNDVVKKAKRYELLLSDLKRIKEGESQMLIIDGRAYVVAPAEVEDLETVPKGRVFGAIWD